MKTLIAIPSFDQIPVEFVGSLVHMERPGLTNVAFLAGTLIYDARERLLRAAIEEKADRILWLDSDMTFSPSLLIDLAADLDDGKDIVTGLCFRRRPPYTPALYKKIRMGLQGQSETEGYDDYPEDEIFEVDACGFAGLLMRTEVGVKVLEKMNAAFIPIPGYGEDISFCIRAKQLGYRLWCDSRVKLGHVGRSVITEDTFRRWRAEYGSDN